MTKAKRYTGPELGLRLTQGWVHPSFGTADELIAKSGVHEHTLWLLQAMVAQQHNANLWLQNLLEVTASGLTDLQVVIEESAKEAARNSHPAADGMAVALGATAHGRRPLCGVDTAGWSPRSRRVLDVLTERGVLFADEVTEGLLLGIRGCGRSTAGEVLRRLGLPGRTSNDGRPA
jgi:hypothetical protein